MCIVYTHLFFNFFQNIFSINLKDTYIVQWLKFYPMELNKKTKVKNVLNMGMHIFLDFASLLNDLRLFVLSCMSESSCPTTFNWNSDSLLALVPSLGFSCAVLSSKVSLAAAYKTVPGLHQMNTTQQKPTCLRLSLTFFFSWHWLTCAHLLSNWFLITNFLLSSSLSHTITQEFIFGSQFLPNPESLPIHNIHSFITYSTHFQMMLPEV